MYDGSLDISYQGLLEKTVLQVLLIGTVICSTTVLAIFVFYAYLLYGRVSLLTEGRRTLAEEVI